MCSPCDYIQDYIFGSPTYFLCTTNISFLLSYVTLYFLVMFFRDTMFVIAFFLNHVILLYSGIFDMWITVIVPQFTYNFSLVLDLFTPLVSLLLQIKSSVDWLSSSIIFLRPNYCSGLELSCNMILNFYPFFKNELALPLSELVILESPLSIYFIFVFIVENVFLVLLISFFVFYLFARSTGMDDIVAILITGTTGFSNILFCLSFLFLQFKVGWTFFPHL